MALTRRNLLTSPFASSRSSLTCAFKCGDACRGEAPNERAAAVPFAAVARRAIGRRAALRAGGALTLALGGASALAACGAEFGVAGGAAGTESGTGSGPGPGMDFTPVPANSRDEVVVPEGYRAEVLIAWGDPVVDGAPDFDFDNQSAAAQRLQFGFNNDFGGLVRGADGTLLYCCSHEYTTEPMMFRGWSAETATAEQVAIGLAAHGHTVLAVAEGPDGLLTRIPGDRRNRRITGADEFTLAGPVAGHALVRTSADPAGRTVAGTLNNCSGGITPWGTMLSGEENVDQYFGGADRLADEDARAALARYAITGGGSRRGWERHLDRFDVTREPHEPNRFYWIVEIDPDDPDSTPVKRTALGRFKHEAGQIHLADDGRAVCYMGDDERFEYVYKFVSSRVHKPGDKAHNARILDEGTLYVARFDGNSPAAEIDGSGQLPADGAFDGELTWIPLVTSHADGTAESHVPGMTGVEALVRTRLAGDAVGATRMDRPEDIEASPATGRVYVALTNNKYRGRAGAADAGVDGAGRAYEGPTEVAPVTANKNGLVLEIDDEHAGERGRWRLLLVCGDPAEAHTWFGGFDKTAVSAISCPDNLAFDVHGNLWISTDGNALGGNDGLYAVAVAGPRRGETRRFLTVPAGAETCGPVIGERRVLVNVQHPGETDDARAEAPSSHWPDGGAAQPRPAVVQVVRADGGRIGG